MVTNVLFGIIVACSVKKGHSIYVLTADRKEYIVDWAEHKGENAPTVKRLLKLTGEWIQSEPKYFQRR